MAFGESAWEELADCCEQRSQSVNPKAEWGAVAGRARGDSVENPRGEWGRGSVDAPTAPPRKNLVEFKL